MPQDIRELVNLDSHRFIFQRGSQALNEHEFVTKLRPKQQIVSSGANGKRTWLAETVMTGKLTCGRQINAGIALPPPKVFTSFDTTGGKLTITPGGGPPPGLINRGSASVSAAEIPDADLVPGTTRPKSSYTNIFESEMAFNKCVYTPSIQYRIDPRQTLHTGRPVHFIANRLFKGSLGDHWKIEGGEMTRGYVMPTGMFSNCFLV